MRGRHRLPRRREGRPRDHLHADGAGSGDRDARRRPARRRPLRRLRRLRVARARRAHRRRQAEAGHHRLVWSRAGADRVVQTAPRRRHRSGDAQAGALHRLPAPDGAGADDARARSGLGRDHGERHAARLRAGCGDRSALHPVHLRHHRSAEGHRSRQRRPPRRARMEHEELLRRRAGRGVLGRLGYRLGRRPFLYRLRAAAPRLHDRPL